MDTMWQNQMQEIDYVARRKAFLSKIKGGVAVFHAAPEVVRNHDVHHPYRQDSNFYYLTAFEEPSSLALFSPQSDAPFQLFVAPKDPLKELWEGEIIGPEAAKSTYGADEAFPSTPESFFEEAFIAAMLESDRLFYRLGIDAARDQKIFSLLQKAARRLGRTGRPFWPIHDPNEVLGEMRVIKSKAEIDRLQIAASISSEAHVNAMRLAKPGMFEYEVEAILYHAFRVHGASRVGYSSIVGSGANACCLHYVTNKRKMEDGDMLLVDAGAEFEYYTADITRVFPVGGQFTQPQRDIYAAVLRAQKECIQMARPGKTLREIHAHSVEVLTEEMRRLKILKGSTASLIKNRGYHAYFPHNIGHWLGMDVHDAGKYYVNDYDEARKLQPGMVFTIEPGLYFGLDSAAPSRYKGIGVRIEDDVVVTSNGVKVLTSGVPKEIEEVESLCSHT